MQRQPQAAGYVMKSARGRGEAARQWVTARNLAMVKEVSINAKMHAGIIFCLGATARCWAVWGANEERRPAHVNAKFAQCFLWIYNYKLKLVRNENSK